MTSNRLNRFHTFNTLKATALGLSLSLLSVTSFAVAPPIDAGKTHPAPGAAAKASTATADAAAKTLVFDDLEQSVAKGEKRFNQSCVYCHGNRGSGGKAKQLQGRNFDADYLFKTITKGKRRGALVMPPWEKTFSDQERWELVTFILSLSPPDSTR
ncbi:c-type cytochrome [Marinobacterium sedimentorum]|uniref:c-type cytochrome n=1 Tax=Marinobacterium sedimentorum TaxID=2927804 RepID=UPI0020C5E8A8|nr:cytochrome c [Marinobacterium sedimentorum]MCP8686578.1 cytochrome c [Marinobacterium sedimentorum]